jgi:hypothetical protein
MQRCCPADDQKLTIFPPNSPIQPNIHKTGKQRFAMTNIVELISKVAQSVAVIAGIGIATYELVLKDRDQDRQRIELTLKQLEVGLSSPLLQARKRLYALEDFAYRTPGASPGNPGSEIRDYKMRIEVSERFDDDTRELAYFYNTISRCYEAGYCVRNLVLALLCEDAYRDLNAIGQLDGRIGNRYFTPHFFQGLARIQHSCEGQKPIAVPYLQPRK